MFADPVANGAARLTTVLRYLDEWQQRDGEWRILTRVVVVRDWACTTRTDGFRWPSGGNGLQPGSAMTKPLNSKPGDTVQPTSVNSPSVLADCHTCASMTTCGRSPRARSDPRTTVSTGAPSRESANSSGAPA